MNGGGGEIQEIPPSKFLGKLEFFECPVLFIKKFTDLLGVQIAYFISDTEQITGLFERKIHDSR